MKIFEFPYDNYLGATISVPRGCSLPEIGDIIVIPNGDHPSDYYEVISEPDYDCDVSLFTVYVYRADLTRVNQE